MYLRVHCMHCVVSTRVGTYRRAPLTTFSHRATFSDGGEVPSIL